MAGKNALHMIHGGSFLGFLAQQSLNISTFSLESAISRVGSSVLATGVARIGLDFSTTGVATAEGCDATTVVGAFQNSSSLPSDLAIRIGHHG